MWSCIHGLIQTIPRTDWSHCFYQYANRLAHLYLLRESNGLDAFLVFVYFVDDRTVPNRDPVSETFAQPSYRRRPVSRGVGA